MGRILLLVEWGKLKIRLAFPVLYVFLGQNASRGGAGEERLEKTTAIMIRWV
jgi:hypothetical protein